jgi:hypothetical protein
LADLGKSLFHISEKPGIRVFEPRECSNPLTGRNENIVWAIDEGHVQNYLLPRDCPRVTFYADKDTAAGDVQRLMCGSTAKHVIAVESAWLERIRGDVVYEYAFDPEGFELVDETAGYYVSKKAVKPKSVRKVDDMLAELLKHDVELRVMPSLWELREEVIRSTMQYSIIRMRNAAPPAKGLGGFHPLPE